jgi:hypothetical protein
MKLKFMSAVIVLSAITGGVCYAHGALNEDLGATSTATDIVLFRCPAQAANIAVARIRDVPSAPEASTIFKVQIANATSPTTCPASTSAVWNATSPIPSQLAPAGGSWSPSPGAGTIPVTANSYYCVKVNRASGSGADAYTVDHHCVTSIGALHQASILISKPLDQ